MVTDEGIIEFKTWGVVDWIGLDAFDAGDVAVGGKFSDLFLFFGLLSFFFWGIWFLRRDFVLVPLSTKQK
jgi:hypothetical protein